MKQTHITTINAIHKANEPFAIWEIAEETGLGRDSVRYIVHRLRILGYLRRTQIAFASKFWRRSKRWPDDAARLIEDYEWWVASRSAQRVGNLSR